MDIIISEIYKEFYTNSKFVKVAKRSPQTKQTLGNNDCIIYPNFDKYYICHTNDLAISPDTIAVFNNQNIRFKK